MANTVQVVPQVARLLVLENGASRAFLLGNQPIQVGRAANNDVVLASSFVSGLHAVIEADGGGHRITNRSSTNKLWMFGKAVDVVNFRHGTKVLIGDPNGDHVALEYFNPGVAAVVQPVLNRPAPNQPVSKSVGGVSDFALSAGRSSIGRMGSGAAIVLESPQVSRIHTHIDTNGAGFVISDAGSTNGTFVNGQALKKSRTLRDNDVIQVGPYRVTFNAGRVEWPSDPNALKIEARGLTRTVSKRSGFELKAKPKTILRDVSLCIQPGEFVALVGGSGAGKSTLMKALSGYVRANPGVVLVNGDNLYRNFDAYNANLGFVPQKDIIHKSLTVERALRYAAQLRLPPDTTLEEIEARVEGVLKAVEMGPYRDRLASDLSGGQLKRLSISVELLAEPKLLFLDEPTSGLDPGLDKKMMQLLRKLADQGRTVVLVTHATASIEQTCHHVVFMSLGRMVFFGPPQEAKVFFAVSDFADIYSKLEEPDTKSSDFNAVFTVAVQGHKLEPELKVWQAKNGGGTPQIAELWELRFRNSSYFKTNVSDRLGGQLQPAPSTSTSSAATVAPASPWRQFGILTRRYADLTFQDKSNLFLLLAQVPVVALLLVMILKSDALSITNEIASRYAAQKVLFMLATIGVWFGIINAAREITKESDIFERERLFNLRIAPYVASKFLVLGLLALIQTVLLLGILAVRVKYPGGDGIVFAPFLEIFVTALLTSLCGTALGLAISASSPSPDRAISIVPILLIPQILFAGLIFKIEGAATPLSWFTVSRWAMGSLGSSLDLNKPCPTPFTEAICENSAMYTHSWAHLGQNWLVLVGMTVVFLLLTTIFLRSRDGKMQ